MNILRAFYFIFLQRAFVGAGNQDLRNCGNIMFLSVDYCRYRQLFNL